MTKKISDGVVHITPDDLRKMLLSDPDILALWEDFAPARPQRMDLLDRRREKTRNPSQAH